MHGADHPEMLITPGLPQIFLSATKHKIGIVGIDPRMDDPQWIRHVNSGHELSVNDMFGYDKAAAENAINQLSNINNSKMVILYGSSHFDAGGKPYIDRPPILSEILSEKYTISTSPLYSDKTQKIEIKDYKIIKSPTDISKALDEAYKKDPEFRAASDDFKLEIILLDKIKHNPDYEKKTRKRSQVWNK
jgi:hypothetical protein